MTNEEIQQLAKGLASKEIRSLRRNLRQAIADYMISEGCGCCQSPDHDSHRERIAKLLGVKTYSDGSGYDFSKYQSKQQ